jgi:hypothetical protein
VHHALNVSRVLREMGFGKTAANLWAAIVPGLTGGKPIDRARSVVLGAEACEASHEGGRSASRLADIVEQDALDAPAGSAQRFLRAAAALAQAGTHGWRHDRGALETRVRAVALCQADPALAPPGFRALLTLIDEAVIHDRLPLARRALDAASNEQAPPDQRADAAQHDAQLVHDQLGRCVRFRHAVIVHPPPVHGSHGLSHSRHAVEKWQAGRALDGR